MELPDTRPLAEADPLADTELVYAVKDVLVGVGAHQCPCGECDESVIVAALELTFWHGQKLVVSVAPDTAVEMGAVAHAAGIARILNQYVDEHGVTLDEADAA